MPQLDVTIIFTQIFWLCVLFSLFYFILSFYLLPNFLVSLKLRKFILDKNNAKLLEISESLLENKTTFKKSLNAQLENLCTNFEKINLTLCDSHSFPSNPIDYKLLSSTFQVTLFCDFIVFKNIFFYPKFFNKSK